MYIQPMTRSISNSYKRFASAAVLGVSTFVATPPADAHLSGDAEVFEGALLTQVVACESLCTEGDMTGELEALFEFTLTSMQETPDPDVVYYEGLVTVTTDDGVLSGTDVGLWNVATGDVVDYTVFDSGSGEFDGQHGYLVIRGNFTLEDGGDNKYLAVVTD